MIKELVSFLFGFCGGVSIMALGLAFSIALDGLVRYGIARSEIELHSNAAFYGFSVGTFFLVVVAILVREHGSA